MKNYQTLEIAERECYFWLDAILPRQHTLVGDSALILSQLYQRGLPLLPGFVIPANICRQFLRDLANNNSLLSDFPDSSFHLPADNPRSLQAIAHQSRQTILEARLPEAWLGRWLAAAADLQSPTLILRPSLMLPRPLRQDWSGLLPSHLCCCRPDALELALKRVWGGLFSARSLFYWQRLGINLERLNFAVLVQPIQTAIASGKAEIVEDSWQIQATCGLGHSLHRGEVLPDCYQINQETGRIETQQLGNKTSAYRIQALPTGLGITEDYLERYWLSPEEQARPALDAIALDNLFCLLKSLNVGQFSQISLEWTLLEGAGNRDRQFYITQFFPISPPSPPSPRLAHLPVSSISPSPALIKGLSASPGRAIAPIEVIDDYLGLLPAIPEGSIWVARQINPAWLPWLKTAAGLILENSGTTCHAAILARELGIPAIVGAAGATERLVARSSVLLDGNSGAAFAASSGQVGQFASPTQSQLGSCPPTTSTQLMVNLSQPDSIAQAVSLPVGGVGLLRSELLLLDILSSRSLGEWLEEPAKKVLIAKIRDLISQFAAAFAPRPIFYRSFDNKLTAGRRQRGTASYLADATLFQVELQALAQVQAAGHDNVHLILPLVRSVEEFRFCRRLVQAAGLGLPACQLWMMAEVPSTLFLLRQYVAAGVQGIAIGSNDLAQFLLGVEREQLSLPDSSHSYYTALMGAIEQLAKLARALNLPCSICGQLPVQHPEAIPSLIDWGISAISVEPEAVTATYQAIAAAETQGNRQ